MFNSGRTNLKDLLLYIHYWAAAWSKFASEKSQSDFFFLFFFFCSLFLIKPGAQACLVVYIQAQAAMWRRQWGSVCEPESSFKRLSPEVIRLSATHCATDPIKHKHRPKHFTDWHTGVPQPSSQPLFSLGFPKALTPLCCKLPYRLVCTFLIKKKKKKRKEVCLQNL